MRKDKYHVLYIVAIAILFSLITINNNIGSNSNSNNVSALSYSSSVGIGFTFNPTLSVSISPSDLIINNLIPGSSSDSNIINVSVATNASYGYTLSAMMNGNNSDLTHTDNSINNSNNNGNSNNVFSSIATDSSLSNLVTDNTWGYSYKLSNDTNWNNYSGLSNETSKTLVDSNDQTAIPIDFKIGAKAASTQPSGTYTGTINFTAVTKPTPMNLAESYFAAGKTRHNGYYAMQDMTTEICNNTEVIGEGSQTELIDLRDDKVYWATKLADGHCWMTQDLDLDSNRTYTHWDTDLGWSTENGNTINENATWRPAHSTIDFTIGSTISGWQNSSTEPDSANPGDVYFYTSNSDADDIQYNSLQECINANHNDCTHYHAGNYYNWSAAVASTNRHSMIRNEDSSGSICPSNWTLPSKVNNDFGILLYNQGIITNANEGGYVKNGFYHVRLQPLYLVRCGSASYSGIGNIAKRGEYWTKTYDSNDLDFYLSIRDNSTTPINNYFSRSGLSVRCLAK